MRTAKMKKNQLVATASPLVRQYRVARRERRTVFTSGQRFCHDRTMTRNRLVQTKRWARISGGETVLRNFQ